MVRPYFGHAGANQQEKTDADDENLKAELRLVAYGSFCRCKVVRRHVQKCGGYQMKHPKARHDKHDQVYRMLMMAPGFSGTE